MPDTNEDENSSIRRQPDTGVQAAPPTGPQATSTGEPSVDAMIARLDGLDGLPLQQHVAVFEETHAGLRQVLSELDAAPDGAAGQPGPGGPGPGKPSPGKY